MLTDVPAGLLKNERKKKNEWKDRRNIRDLQMKMLFALQVYMKKRTLVCIRLLLITAKNFSVIINVLLIPAKGQ